MHSLQINWSRVHKDFPITVAIGVINLMLFVLGWLNVVPALISMPEILNVGTFGAHFFHISPIHLGSNLLILLLVGRILEPVLKWKMIPITILIWLGTIGILWVLNDTPVLGFSGIAMGLLTFALLLYKHDKYWSSLLWPLVAINIFFGLMPGISWWGHLGGAIAGALVFGLWKLLKR